jgi:hypothetical protein
VIESAVKNVIPHFHTNLGLPPPLPGANIPINADIHVGISVMALGLKLEVWYQIVTSIYFTNTSKDITVEEFEGFAVDFNL